VNEDPMQRPGRPDSRARISALWLEIPDPPPPWWKAASTRALRWAWTAAQVAHWLRHVGLFDGHQMKRQGSPRPA
jgi:hypothetical protein